MDRKVWCWFFEWNRVIALAIMFEKDAYGIAIGPALFGFEKKWKNV